MKTPPTISSDCALGFGRALAGRFPITVSAFFFGGGGGADGTAAGLPASTSTMVAAAGGFGGSGSL